MHEIVRLRIDFTRCVGVQIVFATQQGIDLIVDQTRRSKMEAEWNASHCRQYLGRNRCERTYSDPAHKQGGSHSFQPIGIADSVHINGLGVDTYGIVDGKLSNDPVLYGILGEHWKTLHSLARWGGDFESFKDYGHFSFEYQGRK